jgi:hypothetical protein
MCEWIVTLGQAAGSPIYRVRAYTATEAVERAWELDDHQRRTAALASGVKVVLAA